MVSIQAIQKYIRQPECADRVPPTRHRKIYPFVVTKQLSSSFCMLWNTCNIFKVDITSTISFKSVLLVNYIEGPARIENFASVPEYRAGPDKALERMRQRSMGSRNFFSCG